MTQPTGDTRALPLYNHTTRKDWGIAILVREDEGKRGYLFEDGSVRTMANGYHQLMHRVERPSAEQIAFYERQRTLIERRENARSSTSLGGPSFLDQLDKLHATYPAGLADPKWVTGVRGEGVKERTPAHRDALIREAQEQLSAATLDALLKKQGFAQIWSSVTALLGRTDLVPAVQLKKTKLVNNEGLRVIAPAVRELLHGVGPYEQRFGAYLVALTSIYGEAPHWEIATALTAAFFPDEHICVQPAAFRQQLKAMGARGSAPARATAAAYTRFLSVARMVSDKLTEQGQPPRDLFDVGEFVRLTLGSPAKTKVKSVKARAKSAAPAPADAEEAEEGED